MQRPLRAGWLIVASAIAAVPIGAQEAPRAEIAAPAPLTLPHEGVVLLVTRSPGGGDEVSEEP
jgi:hypothetical protein